MPIGVGFLFCKKGKFAEKYFIYCCNNMIFLGGGKIEKKQQCNEL
jgi:hypothetical protein